MMRPHSICACRFPLASRLCHLRLRLPVEGSCISTTAYQLLEPAGRSRTWPFMIFLLNYLAVIFCGRRQVQNSTPVSHLLEPHREAICQEMLIQHLDLHSADGATASLW